MSRSVASPAWVLLAVAMAVAALVAVITGAGPAGAHAEVRDSTPAAGDEVSEGIDEVELEMLAFDADEPVSVEVLDDDGRDHAVGDPVVAARDSSISQATEPLPPGDYRIHWHAIADDGDGLSEGDVEFRVVAARDDTGNVLFLWAIALVIPGLFVVSRLRRR